MLHMVKFMNENIFREYDIRGIAEIDLTDDVAYLIGRAFAFCSRRAKPQLTRLSGQDASEVVVFEQVQQPAIQQQPHIWSDEQLIAQGWTQEQIVAYRNQQGGVQ